MEEAESELFVGLDVHRKTVVATVLDATGRRVDQTSLGASDSELMRYLEALPGTKRVVLEACSMWEHYYDAAASTGASVTLSNPYKTRLIAEASLKSDKVDSEALARLLRVDSVPTAFAPPPEVRALRALVTERVFYSRKATSVMNHLYFLLYRRGIEYEDRVLTRKRKRESLRSLGITEVGEGLDVLSSIEATRKTLDRAIHTAWAESPDAQLLSTIPGIGKWTAVALVAYLCPVDRFASAEHMSSYVGLVPSHHQSAEHQYNGPLKRDSNALIRWALIEASWIHRRKHPRGAVAKISKRVGRRRGASRGTVAGAHKLVKIVFAMLKRKEPFRRDAPEPSTAVKPLRRRKTTAR